MKNRKSFTSIIALLIPVLSVLLLTTPLTGADQPRFEEASVKHTDQCSMNNSVDPGRVVLNGDPLIAVLMEAFGVKSDQITGPSWLESVSGCFTVIAKIPEGATKDQLPAMFQTLLAERFKLVAHKESHLRPGYDLIVDKNGPKFKEPEQVPATSNVVLGVPRGGGTTFGYRGQGGIIKGSMTMAAFAGHLSRRLDGPVQDHTGLTGTYDINLAWAADSAGADAPAGLASIFTAMRESLGLRLEPHKSPVETVVIDHIERIPTDN